MNKADQNVTGNDNNANNSTETTQRHQLTRDILFPNLESVRNEQNYNPVGLSTAEKLLLVVWKAKSLQIYWSNTYLGCCGQTKLNIIKNKTGVQEEVKNKNLCSAVSERKVARSFN